MSTCVSSQWLLEASSIFISQSVQSVPDLLPCDSIKIRLQPTPSCSCELDRYKKIDGLLFGILIMFMS